MSVSWSNFLFEVANFVVLVAALGWALFRPVRAALDEETKRQAEAEALLEDRRRKAGELEQQTRQAKERLEGELEARRSELLELAQKEAGRIREQAQKEAVAERQRLEVELESVRNADVAALGGALAEIAGASVARLLEALDASSLDAALARAACAQIVKLDPGQRATAIVESARPLDDRSRSLLSEALGSQVREQIVSELGAGVRLTTESGQIDASALAMARLATREVARELSTDTAGAPRG